MDNLSLSLLHSIRGFLCLQDLHCSRGVCKSWEDAKCERLTIKFGDLNTCPAYVDLPNIINLQHDIINHKDFEIFMRYCHQSRYALKQLKIRLATFHRIHSYIPFMPNLESLVVFPKFAGGGSAFNNRGISFIQDLIKHAPNVKKINLDGLRKVDLYGLHLNQLALGTNTEVVNVGHVGKYYITQDHSLENIENILKTKSTLILGYHHIHKNTIMIVTQYSICVYSYMCPDFEEKIKLVKRLRHQCKLCIKSKIDDMFIIAEKLRKLGCFTHKEIVQALKVQ